MLVERVLVDGWSPAAAAEAMSVSRATAYKWLARFTAEGLGGLKDRTSAPHRRPRALREREIRRIIAVRSKTGWGPHRLGPWLGHPRSTVYGVLHRRGVPRLADLDRPTRTIVRYEKDRPGELVHIDVKKLARIPSGGGWRKLGRSTELRRRPKLGYDYLHAAVDDHTRIAFVEVHPDERGETCAGFLARASVHFATLGIGIEAVMTDNAKNYVLSGAFSKTLGAIGAGHLTTRPYRPQTNGKVERFNRTMLEEWAYVKLYRSNGARLHALDRWVEFYNARRPHTALGGRPPMSRASTT